MSRKGEKTVIGITNSSKFNVFVGRTCTVLNSYFLNGEFWYTLRDNDTLKIFESPNVFWNEIQTMEDNLMKNLKIIELNLYAEGAYSGAEYNEVVFITPQDYIKYFGSGQDTNAETFEEYVMNKWEDREIYVGELDGKHSEVSGNVEVEFWDAERIAEFYDNVENDGEYLMNSLVEEAKCLGESRFEIMENIKKHVNEVVESIGTKVTIECRVPKDKVEELRAFVEQLNK